MVTDIRNISIFPTNLHPVIPTNGISVVCWKSGYQGYLFALCNLVFLFLSARHRISGVIYIFLFSLLLFLFSDVAEFFTLRRRGLLKSDERVRFLGFSFFFYQKGTRVWISDLRLLIPRIKSAFHRFNSWLCFFLMSVRFLFNSLLLFLELIVLNFKVICILVVAFQIS